MFFNKRYAQASIAFLRAGRNREAAICDAYLLRERARSTSTSASKARVKAFLAAADAFIACAQNSLPKQINERLAYCRTAGECYSETGSLKEIGDSYRLDKRYAATACIYREEGCFDQLVELIAQHGDAIGGGLLEDLKMAAQMHYLEVCHNGCRISECLSPPWGSVLVSGRCLGSVYSTTGFLRLEQRSWKVPPFGGGRATVLGGLRAG